MQPCLGKGQCGQFLASGATGWELTNSLALPYTGHVTLGKRLTPLQLGFLIYSMMRITVPASWYYED